MQKISIGKFRALQQCTSSRGTFTCLALDHRQNLRKANPVFQSDDELSSFKLDVTRELASFATAVLLDPEVSAAQAIASGVLPGDKGLIVAVESTGYGGSKFERKTQMIPGWSVEKAKRLGASMVKLLVYFHPESSTSREIIELVSNIAEQCQKYDIGLMLEPLSYPLDDSKLSSEAKRWIVVETARVLTKIPGVDILKAELPLDINDHDHEKLVEACSEVSRSSSVPWILLSASVPFEVFLQHTKIACQAGASGVAVGRAVWQETITMGIEDRRIFLHSTASNRLEQLAAECMSLGKPWTEFYSTNASFDWYKKY
jgi:tagatose-1,6-bisphosphate aldolase